jgi:hypothetical protein
VESVCGSAKAWAIEIMKATVTNVFDNIRLQANREKLLFKRFPD